MTCSRCTKELKIFPDGLCGFCQIITGGFPGVAGCETSWYNPDRDPASAQMAHSLKIASEFSDGDRSKISSKNAARYMQSLVAPMQYDEHRANQKQNRFAMMDAAEKTHAQEDAINTDNARLLKESEVAVKKLGSELGMNG